MRVWLSVVLGLLVVAGCGRGPTSSANAPTESSAAATNAAALSATGASSNPAPGTGASAIPAPEPAPPAPAVSEVATLKQAVELKSTGNLVAARNLLQPLADQPDASTNLVALLGDINVQIALTPVPAPEKIEYTVVAGDSLGKIAKHYGTTIDLIKQSNLLSADLIRLGGHLRIYQGEFAVTVNKADNSLTVTDHGRLFKRYAVGTGQYSKTPVGQFKVTSRVVHPTWWRGDKDIPYGDPDNILGTHWLGLDIPGYGIHGTWDDTAIGKQSTAGCVRLRNPDIEQLYCLLPVGTPVTIRE